MAAPLTDLKLLRADGQRLAAAKRRPSAVAQVRLPWSLCTAAPSVPSDHEPWHMGHLVFGGDCRLSSDGDTVTFHVLPNV